MSSPKQKALFLKEKFAELVIDTNDVPTPGAGELLVKIKASALNPVDWKIQRSGAFPLEYPAVLGSDIAGDVEEVGEGVTGISKGDRVFFQGVYTRKGAGFQQYNIGVATTVAKIPESFSYDEAATFPVTLTCSYIGLYNKYPYGLGFDPLVKFSDDGKYSSTPLVILGGAASVGQSVIQLAKASGFSPIIVTASLKHTEYLQSLGATHVIDRNIPLSSLASEVEKITKTPITTVFDAVSAKDTQQAGYELLTSGGQIAVVQNPAVEDKTDDKKVVHVLGILNAPHNIDLLRKLYSALPGLLVDGVLKPNKVEVLPSGLAGIPDGLKRLQNGDISGIKLVAHPQETV